MIAADLGSALQEEDQMPQPVRARLKSWARERAGATARTPGPRQRQGRPRLSIRPMGLEAAAAILIVGVAIFGSIMLRPSLTIPQPRDAARDRNALIASDPAALSGHLVAREKGLNASGDAVWSETEGRGFLRIKGLPDNEPRVTQYQVWIAPDESWADARSAGVFNAEKVAGFWVVEFAPARSSPAGQTPRMVAVATAPPGGSAFLDPARLQLQARLR